jgi:preprotein translocase subunit YajC
MFRFLSVLLETISFFLKRGKSKEEKEKDKFNEALAKDDHINLSGSLSDSFDRVHREKGRNHPE